MGSRAYWGKPACKGNLRAGETCAQGKAMCRGKAMRWETPRVGSAWNLRSQLICPARSRTIEGPRRKTRSKQTHHRPQKKTIKTNQTPRGTGTVGARNVGGPRRKTQSPHYSRMNLIFLGREKREKSYWFSPCIA